MPVHGNPERRDCRWPGRPGDVLAVACCGRLADHRLPESGALVFKADVEVDRRDFVLDAGQALQEGEIVRNGCAP
jgi:hypothetical protein